VPIAPPPPADEIPVPSEPPPAAPADAPSPLLSTPPPPADAAPTSKHRKHSGEPPPPADAAPASKHRKHSGEAAPPPADAAPSSKHRKHRGDPPPPAPGDEPPGRRTGRAASSEASGKRHAPRIARLLAQSEGEVKVQRLLEAEDARIEAVYQFNASPNKNIGKLCEYFHRGVTPADVAFVFHHTPGLLGEKIGEFLAKPDHEPFMKAYFQAIDLHVNFLEAMRRGLSGPFFMPGEAQQVERTIQALSEVYMEQNPGIFGHVNDPVVLGFALVMLNTDMLKPNVTRKMTVQEFVANTSGAFEHSKFPREQLELMYASLKENPFAFAPKSNDFMALCAPKKRGWMKKKSARFGGSWKLHYFVLTMSSLYYFKDASPESKDKPLGNIQLVEVDITADPRMANRFIVTTRADQIQYVKLSGIPQIVAGVKSITFEAKNAEAAAEWLFRLKKSACMGSFLDGSGAAGPPSDGDGASD
jgi:hypothetical protein